MFSDPLQKHLQLLQIIINCMFLHLPQEQYVAQYLFWLQQGTFWHLSPVVILRNEFILYEAVNAICFYYCGFIHFILFRTSSSLRKKLSKKKKKKLTSNYLYYRELTLLFYCGRETDTVSITMLTLVICLSTKEFPEVFSCVGMGIYSFFYSLYIRSSTAKFPLCLN